MRQLALATVTLLGALLAGGCAGGTFVVEAPLRETPALEVKGPLGAYTQSCDQGASKTTVGLRADQPSSAEVGAWAIMVSDPHRDITSEAILGDRVLQDYASFMRNLDGAAANPHRVGDYAKLAVVLAGGPALQSLLGGVYLVLNLPGRIEQTITFSVLATREDRTVLGVCRSTDVVHFLGSFDQPNTSLACRFVPTSDNAARNLRVTGYGSWANFAFKGTLEGPSPDERAIFESQNISIMGTGGVRGFDLRRTAPPSEQLAAISFFQEQVGKDVVARAWLNPKATSPWGDAIATATALSYVFPWPTSCDSYQLRGEAASKRGYGH